LLGLRRNLRLWSSIRIKWTLLARLLTKRIILFLSRRFLALPVTAKLVEALARLGLLANGLGNEGRGAGRLRDGLLLDNWKRESRSRFGLSRLLWSRLVSWRGWKRSLGLRNRGVLWWLGASFRFLAVFIYVQRLSITIQAQATKLNSSTIQGMVARHNYRFLLLQQATLEAC
jgi:hypothetical protein